MLKAQQKAGIVAGRCSQKSPVVTLVVSAGMSLAISFGSRRNQLGFLETDGQRSVNPKLFPVNMMKPFGSPGRGYSEIKAMLTLRWNLQMGW